MTRDFVIDRRAAGELLSTLLTQEAKSDRTGSTPSIRVQAGEYPGQALERSEKSVDIMRVGSA